MVQLLLALGLVYMGWSLGCGEVVVWCSGDGRWGGHIEGGGGAVSLFVKWGVVVGKMGCGGW